MGNIGKTLAVLTMIFFVVAVSTGCARRPRPEPTAVPAPPALPGPKEEEEIPPTTAETEPSARAGEPSASPTGPTPGQMGEEKVARSEESEVAAVAELEDIHFDFDKYDIRPGARPILEKNAQWIKGHPGIKLQIEGHCDERGTVEYNLALGERRTKAVRGYLISLGVDPGQLSAISFGEERPLDLSHNEEAWAKNRRAHFVILK